jgi:hypothetical protein
LNLKLKQNRDTIDPYTVNQAVTTLESGQTVRTEDVTTVTNVHLLNGTKKAPNKEGTMSIWNDAPKNSQAVFEHLKDLAKRMRTESYGEIAQAIGISESRKVAAVGLRYPLGFIRDRICRPRGLPWLNALAVNSNTWLPGDGFLPEGMLSIVDDEYILWRGTILAVFTFPWEQVIIE